VQCGNNAEANKGATNDSRARRGAPGFDVAGWWGVLAPANAPRPIIVKIHSGIVKALATPRLASAFEAEGTEVVVSSPEEFTTFLARDIDKWKKALASSRDTDK